MASSKNRSLRSVIILPYILIIVTLIALISTLSYRAEHNSISKVSNYLLKENVNRISQAIEKHLSKSKPVLQTAFPNATYNLKNIHQEIDSLLPRFLLSKSLNPTERANVYFGNELGQAFGLFDGTKHHITGTTAMITTKASTTKHMIPLKGQTFSNRNDIVHGNFNVHKRPWYKLSKANKNFLWTPIYIDKVTNELVITRTRQLHNDQNQFTGAVATDISLKALGDFIANIDMSQNGMAIIVDAENKLIASSISPYIKHSSHNQPIRLHAYLNENRYVSDVYQAVMKDTPNIDKLALISTTFQDSHNQTIHAAGLKMEAYPELNWTIIAAMPQSDFMGNIRKNIYATIFLCFLVMLLIIGIGLLTVNWITADLVHLSLAVKQIGLGKHDISIPVHRNDEIGHLATALRKMLYRLQTDKLTGLLNKESCLKHIKYKISISNPENKATFFAVVYINLAATKSNTATSSNEEKIITDDLLTIISSTLKAKVREEDILCRCCHADFIIVLDKIDNYEKLERIVEEIKRLFHNPITETDPNSPDLQCNIGMSYYPEDGLDALTLVNAATERLQDMDNQPIKIGWIKPAQLPKG